MKKIIRLTLIVIMLSGVACTRNKIIPDDELALIFHDAFLTNAYINVEGINKDSLNIYEPIFAKYGYTTSDVQYTIGNFSKRKSALLSDVVEQAIDILESEGLEYSRRVTILDTINNVARRQFKSKTILDTLIRVRSLRDTSKLKFSLPVEPGTYRLSFDYLVGEADKNGNNNRGAMWLERSDSTQSNKTTIYLRRNYEGQFSRGIEVDSTHSRLNIDIVKFYKNSKRPDITITDLELEYTPAIESAVDMLYQKQLDLRIFADEFTQPATKTDSL